MRRFNSLATVLLALTVLLAAPSSRARADDHARGARLYAENCGRCHNPRGPGEFSDREWPLIITHMRVIGLLPGDQARAIEAFLRASNNPPRKKEVVSAAARIDGRALIQQYGCRGCHVVEGEGGTIGPSLDGILSRRPESWVRQQIADPRANNPRTVMPQLNLSDPEIDAIIDLLRATK